MKLTELISDTKLAYHDEINPNLWSGDDPELDPRVRDHLIVIANQFTHSLKIPDSAVVDYILTGSNANYNWTKFSDIDIHVMVNYDELDCDGGECSLEAEDCLMAKKSLWNDRHDITIRGHPVECYASRSTDRLVNDSGSYSILRNEWIQRPSWRSLKIDSAVITKKADELAKEIDSIVGSKTTSKDTINEITEKLWKYRQSGLSRGGEFSVENLVFKTLRNNGYVDKIRQYAIKADDQSLSLED
jgi:hypothetical protein